MISDITCDFEPSVSSDEDVLRLQVAVHHTHGVTIGQTFGNKGMVVGRLGQEGKV